MLAHRHQGRPAHVRTSPAAEAPHMCGPTSGLCATMREQTGWVQRVSRPPPTRLLTPKKRGGSAGLPIAKATAS